MNILSKFSKIKTFIFDVDGVLTDGRILVLEDGQFARSMNVKDGFVLQLAIKKGYNIAIISGGLSEPVRTRLNKLGINDVFLGIENKKLCLEEYVLRHKLIWDEILFMGDDIPDYEPMKMCGLPCCPEDAVPEIKSLSHFISSKKGGEGCVREVIEKVLKLNDHWQLNTTIASK